MPYTPGPWKVTPGTHFAGWEEVVAYVIETEDQQHVASVPLSAHGDHVANARMIALAPLMLDTYEQAARAMLDRPTIDKIIGKHRQEWADQMGDDLDIPKDDPQRAYLGQTPYRAGFLTGAAHVLRQIADKLFAAERSLWADEKAPP